uniref:EKA-like protein n=1 Tax=Parastrongyloides trichosuri TaxID=131310 RepID=A0A0N4ZCX0_PARTI
MNCLYQIVYIFLSLIVSHISIHTCNPSNKKIGKDKNRINESKTPSVFKDKIGKSQSKKKPVIEIESYREDTAGKEKTKSINKSITKKEENNQVVHIKVLKSTEPPKTEENNQGKKSESKEDTMLEKSNILKQHLEMTQMSVEQKNTTVLMSARDFALNSKNVIDPVKTIIECDIECENKLNKQIEDPVKTIMQDHNTKDPMKTVMEGPNMNCNNKVEEKVNKEEGKKKVSDKNKVKPVEKKYTPATNKKATSQKDGNSNFETLNMECDNQYEVLPNLELILPPPQPKSRKDINKDKNNNGNQIICEEKKSEMKIAPGTKIIADTKVEIEEETKKLEVEKRGVKKTEKKFSEKKEEKPVESPSKIVVLSKS